MKELARGHKAGADASPGRRCARRMGHQPLDYTAPTQTFIPREVEELLVVVPGMTANASR